MTPAAPAPTSDCEDCGEAIEFGLADGRIQMDAEASCPCCGAVHIVNYTEGDGEQPDVYLVLSKHGAEVIAEVRAGVARLRAALEFLRDKSAEAMANSRSANSLHIALGCVGRDADYFLASLPDTPTSRTPPAPRESGEMVEE